MKGHCRPIADYRIANHAGGKRSFNERVQRPQRLNAAWPLEELGQLVGGSLDGKSLRQTFNVLRMRAEFEALSRNAFPIEVSRNENLRKLRVAERLAPISAIRSSLCGKVRCNSSELQEWLDRPALKETLNPAGLSLRACGFQIGYGVLEHE